MADKKTIQAQKVSATWTPNNVAARAMEKGLDQFPVGAKIIGGRVRFAAALVARYEDAELMAKNADWFKRLRADMDETGVVHTFEITAGAVLKEDVLDPFDVLATALAPEAGSTPVGDTEEGEAA